MMIGLGKEVYDYIEIYLTKYRIYMKSLPLNAKLLGLRIQILACPIQNPTKFQTKEKERERKSREPAGRDNDNIKKQEL
ncbi:hypothetical protein P167DRAFT_539901, partial [Morchella conica CCBAS932]